MATEIITAIIVSLISFFTVFFFTPQLIKALKKRNSAVKDYNKPGEVMVVRPGGPAIILGIISAEIVLYAFSPSNEILAIIVTSFLAFLVGIVDDRKVMGGWFKPVALAFSAIPIILLGAYDSTLNFPLFGEVQIPALYLVIIIMMIPITGNTINSIELVHQNHQERSCLEPCDTCRMQAIQTLRADWQ